LIYFIFVVVFIAVIAIAVTPLNLYYQYIEKEIKPTKLTGVSGSVIKGSAEELTYMNLPLGQAEWFLYPKSYNALAGDVRVTKQHYDLKLDLNRVEQKRVEVEKVRGFIDWELIKPYVQMRYGQLAGFARFNLQGLRYSQTGGL